LQASIINLSANRTAYSKGVHGIAVLPRYKMTNSLNVKVTVYTSEMEQAQALIGLFVCIS